MKKTNVFKLGTSLLICQIAGLLGTFFTTNSSELWYADLAKPAFNPPDVVFGPVWFILYLMMGFAIYRIWSQKKNETRDTAIILFIGQLIMNSTWSLVFFGLKSPLAALVTIMGLWVMIILTMQWFFKIDKLAGWLLVPYFLWVTFAGYLNFMIWELNPFI